MYFFSNKKTLVQRTAAGMLTMLLLGTLCVFSMPKQAYAQVYVPTIDQANLVKDIGFAGFSLDALAWFAVNAVLEAMIADVTEWINTGFKGDPAFVQDLDGLLLGVADDQVGQFLYGTELGFLCSPFKLDVQTALLLEYTAERNFEVQCSISDIVENTEGFLEGDFLAGGWDGWFEMTQKPQNNPYGEFVLGYEELTTRVQNAQGEQLTLLDYGRGFLTQEICEVFESGDGASETSCRTSTPGAVIETQLEETLSIPRDRLTIADELNEALAALVNQLVVKTMQEGLSELTEDNGEGSYIDELRANEGGVDEPQEGYEVPENTGNRNGGGGGSNDDSDDKDCGIKGDPNSCRSTGN